MTLEIVIVAMLMLVLVSGEISTISSPAPSPDLAIDAADSPLIHELGTSPAESPIEYSSPPESGIEHSPSSSPSPNSPLISPPLPDSYKPHSSSPSPSQEVSDINHSDITAVEVEKSSSSGGGKTVGVVFGVITAICVVGLAGFVYKKRQDNIRRARYGYAAREIL